MAEHDDPFRMPEGGVPRPRPGGGRRPGPESTRFRPTVFAPPEPLADHHLHGALGTGLSPLLQAGSPLLLLAGRLRGSVAPMDVGGLRRHAMDALRRFEDQARAAGVANETVMAGRYALCASLDEAVMSTPWGGQSEWAQNPLLVTLHREAWGGEKFFDVLDRVAREPGKFADLLELQYLCLAFGFAGKYHVRERGHEQLAEVQRTLYRRVAEQREAPPPELSPRWRGLEDQRHRVVRQIPAWVVAAAAVAILAVTFTWYYSSLAEAAAPIQRALAGIGRDAFAPADFDAAPDGPTLKQLLAPAEKAGLLRVDEQGARTVVTLRAAGLFASGSADVDPGAVGTLRQVADALDKVPGRVLVVGHTDDQQVRSLRFQDNFHLSRERAVSVARVLRESPGTAGRVSWTGVGASEPLPSQANESAGDYRARNRRVEIVHVRGS